MLTCALCLSVGVCLCELPLLATTSPKTDLNNCHDLGNVFQKTCITCKKYST